MPPPTLYATYALISSTPTTTTTIIFSLFWTAEGEAGGHDLRASLVERLLPVLP